MKSTFHSGFVFSVVGGLNGAINSSPWCVLKGAVTYFLFSIEKLRKVMKICPKFDVPINILCLVGFLVQFPSRSGKATHHLPVFRPD